MCRDGKRGCSATRNPGSRDSDEIFMNKIKKCFRRTGMSGNVARLAALAAALLICVPSAQASSDSDSDSGSGSPQRIRPAAPTASMYYGYGIDEDRKIKEQVLDSSFTVGQDLPGFDISLLRSSKRVENLRYEVLSLHATLKRNFGDPGQTFVTLSCALEFGNKSGVAETKKNEKVLRVLIQELTSKYTVSELRQVVGKIELKNAIARAVNGSLTTARVRKVYLTDFRMMSGHE